MASSRTLLRRLLPCQNFILNLQDLLLDLLKKVISMNYSSSTSSWKPWRWVRLDLIFTMKGAYIYISNLTSLTKFTSSSRSIKFRDISQMIMKAIPIRPRIVISYAMKQASRFDFDGKSMETDTTTWSEFPYGWKAIVEQIIASEKRNKSKRKGLWESQPEIRMRKLTIWGGHFIEKL